MLVSVGELQKNISLLNNIKEPIKNNDLDLFNELIKDDIKVDSSIKGSFENVYIEYLKGKYNFN